MKNLKAFTLLELLIGMIIGSLVISLAIASYFIIYGQYMNYKKVKGTISDFTQLSTTIENDFINASAITAVSENQLVLNTKNNVLINYNFTSQFITRKQNEIIDTFKIGVSNCVPVYIVENGSDKTPLVERFSVDANVLGENEHLLLIKAYSADEIINTLNANN